MPTGIFCEGRTLSIPHYLEKLGYKTALHGKRHIKPESAFPFEYLDADEGALVFPPVDKYLEENKEKHFMLVVASHETHYRWDLGDTTRYDPDSD